MKETARRLLLPIILMASVAGYAQDDLPRPTRVAPDLMLGLDLMPGAPPVPEDMVVLGNLDDTAHEYTVGDSLVVPKGWRGYWEMQGNYRELVVIATPTDSAPSE